MSKNAQLLFTLVFAGLAVLAAHYFYKKYKAKQVSTPAAPAPPVTNTGTDVASAPVQSGADTARNISRYLRVERF